MNKFFFVLLIIPVLLLSGCSAAVNVERPSSTAENTTDNPNMLPNYEIPDINYSRISSLNGFFYNGNLVINGLYIRNLDTSLTYVICNAPGCLHNESDADCLANRFSSMQGLSAVFKDTAVFSALDNDFNTLLYTVNTDGSNLRQIAEFNEYTTNNLSSGYVLVKNHLYFSVVMSDDSIDENGYVNTDKAIFRIYDLDMETGNIKMLFESEEGYSPSEPKIIYDDGRILIVYEIQTRSFEELGTTKHEFYEHISSMSYPEIKEVLGIKLFNVLLDTSTGKYESLNLHYEYEDEDENESEKPELYPDAFMDGRIFCPLNNKICVYNTYTREYSILLEDSATKNFVIYQSADFIMIKKNIKNALLPEITIFLKGSDSPRKLILPEEQNIVISDECPERLCIYRYIGDIEFNPDEAEFIDRKDFLSWCQ